MALIVMLRTLIQTKAATTLGQIGSNCKTYSTFFVAFRETVSYSRRNVFSRLDLRFHVSAKWKRIRSCLDNANLFGGGVAPLYDVINALNKAPHSPQSPRLVGYAELEPNAI
jgi:hypothetical protein